MSLMKDVAVKNIEDLVVHSTLRDADISIDYRNGVATVSATFDLTHKQMESRKLDASSMHRK